MAAAEDKAELEEEVPPEIEETKPIEEMDRVVEDPVVKDAKLSDHNETDNDQETEESLGDPRFNSDSPFEGPGTNGTIGIGGGAGGAFGGRKGGHRNLRAGGGGKKTETAVDLALEWLKNHQSPNGQWECEGFSAQCKLNTCDHPGEASYTPGVSGLALLCFLGFGETHQSGVTITILWIRCINTANAANARVNVASELRTRTMDPDIPSLTRATSAITNATKTTTKKKRRRSFGLLIETNASNGKRKMK
jgi:hypothetical protein